MATKTAQRLKRVTSLGHAALYKLSEPVEWGEDQKTNYVIVSAVDHWTTETYIFPSNEVGEWVDMLELEGSYKGGTDHAKALEGLGFILTSVH